MKLEAENLNEPLKPQLNIGAVMCCFNCVHLGMKPSSGKHWCMNDNSYLSGWITQPHIRKCELHVLEK